MAESTNLSDDAFVQAALKLGILTAEKIEEAKGVQVAMREMKIQATLQEVMQRNGMITPDQIKKVKRALGAAVEHIPGYRILGKIGAGGMGTVYKARQTSVDRTVAIKVLSKLLVKDKNFITRFLNESKAAAALNHTNIIAVYDAGEHEGLYYLVMELAEGPSLRDLLDQNGPLPEEKVKEAGLQVGYALDAIHRHKLLHRDIKPENLVLHRQRTVKLLDFGLAKQQGKGGQSLTTSGIAVGTPLYMSPEQVQGSQKIDIRSDLYSLGATLFHLLTGVPPFIGDTAVATAMKHIAEAPPDPRVLQGGISERMAAVVLKLLEKNPGDRFQTPRDFVHALRGDKPIERPRRIPFSRRIRKKIPLPDWALYGIAAVAGVLLLLIPILRVSGSGSEPVPPPAPPLVEQPPEKIEQPPDPRLAEAQERFEAVTPGETYTDWVKADGELQQIAGQFEGFLPDGFTERLKELKQKIEEADAAVARAGQAFEEGDWIGASAAYDALVPGSIEDQLRKDRIATCRREIEFEAHLEKIKALVSEGRWRDAITAARTTPAEYAQTRGYKEHEKEMQALRDRIRRETEALGLLIKVRLGASGKRWGSFERHVTDFEAYADTQTYESVRDELTLLKASRDAAQRNDSESSAEAAWNRAMLDLSKGNAPRARRGFEAFLKEQVGTAFYKAHRAEAATRLKECNEVEAASILQQLGDAVESKKGDRIGRLLARLGPFAETQAVKKSKWLIRDAEKIVSKVGLMLGQEGFEDGIGNWAGSNDEGIKPKIEVSRDAREGRHSARFTFFRQKKLKGSGLVIRLLDGGLEPEVSEIRFWAKLVKIEGRAARADLYVGFLEGEEGKSVELHTGKVSLSRTWREFTVKVRDLECLFNLGGDKTLDPAGVAGLGFLVAGGQRTVTVAVDDVRILKRDRTKR